MSEPGEPSHDPVIPAGGEPAGESLLPGATSADLRPVRHRRWPKVLAWTAGTLVILLGITALGGFIIYRKLDGNIRTTDISQSIGAPSERPTAVASKPPAVKYSAENILLIGSDTREGADNAGYGSASVIAGARSDTTILLHLAADRKSAVAMSIPRDSWVELPSCKLPGGGTTAPRTDRFNEAFAAGGPACTFRAVERLTQIRLDHYVVIDFGGFKRMIDALGGVEVCLVKAVNDPKSHLKLPAGRTVVNGTQGLAYVRARYSLADGSDLSRIDRQQAFLSSMVTKARTSNLLLKPVSLYQFLDAATKSVTTDPALGSLDAMRKLASSVAGLKDSQVTFLTVPNHPYVPNPNVVEWNARASEAVFEAIREDRPLPGAKPTASPSPTPSSVPSETPSVTPLVTPPANIRVRVLNGSGRTGAAAEAAARLRALGFQVVSYATADRNDYATTTVRRGPAYDESGRTLLAAVPGATEKVDPALGRTLTLVLGRDALAVADTLPLEAPGGSATPTATPTPTPSASPSPVPSIATRTAADDICS